MGIVALWTHLLVMTCLGTSTIDVMKSSHFQRYMSEWPQNHQLTYDHVNGLVEVICTRH